jgi:tetratricopeptide (TPR) repeat protein
MKNNLFISPLEKSDMSTTTLFNHCLTYEQLEKYSLNESAQEEKARIYQHLSTCELCACAVNGFTAVPFTFADVDAIQQHINVRTNATHANPLTFVQVMIVAVSAASIFGFYQFTESFSDGKTSPVPEAVVSSPVIEEPVIALFVSPELELPAKPEDKIEAIVEPAIPERQMISVEPLESLVPDLIQPAVSLPEIITEVAYNADVIYIYDLKVTNYSSLYFNYKTKPFEIKGHTPSFRENKESPDYLAEEPEEAIAADRVLKSAFAHFTKSQYAKALAEFQVLLENNPKDVNALFYSAVAYYQAGKYNQTIKNLEAVLENPNNVFHPEAKWNLALANLKAGNRHEAKQLLTEITNEKGFYSKRAGEKLKGL